MGGIAPLAFGRRTFVLGAAAASLVASAPRALAAPVRDPFTLGVASGDPTPDGMVLWTRLAPDPLAADGLGGMPGRTVPVGWEIAEDEAFARVVQRGVADAVPDSAHTVHVEATGLAPGREYFYRFRAAGALSPAGRTRTAPAPGTLGALTTCVASCADYPVGWFTAYRRLAEDEPGLVLHLGDYQYEYATPEGSVRPVAGPETTALSGYRQRHAQYKTDPDLQAAHAVAPWLVVWDDHEVVDNWAGRATEPGFPERRIAAFRAYYEHMPLRRTSVPRGIDMQLYRRIGWGALATFHLMDTRQYRSDQACGDGMRVGCTARLDPSRSLPGVAQEAWLRAGLRSSGARWDVLGQQVFFAERARASDGAYAMDGWDGYAPSRDRVLAGFADVRNAVVLTGDVHTHWANELVRGDRVVGTELVSSSITSGADGDAAGDHPDLRRNPHLRFRSNRRGYVRARYAADGVTADFRVVDAVTTPGAPVRTAASFVIPDRDPGLHPA
ncbi:alkaline phosphatase D family protein [Pseudonocardia xishanensis]|uniref:Alkaline phosphatase D family protein n=1 Tax=Pseudonocardia xishanensis TaxID=630995 RepID=A0ABP8RFH3_9PSEU